MAAVILPHDASSLELTAEMLPLGITLLFSDSIINLTQIRLLRLTL